MTTAFMSPPIFKRLVLPSHHRFIALTPTPESIPPMQTRLSFDRAPSDGKGAAAATTLQLVTRVAIIGAAGGRGAHERLSKAAFARMCATARRVITEDLRLDPKRVHLVSGGAAWSDHIAVRLFLGGGFAGLTLLLPARWIAGGIHGWYEPVNPQSRRDPGGMSNYYHKRFSDSVEADSLAEIARAKIDGAVLRDEFRGFLIRDLEIARSVDAMIAFSFSDGDAPLEGGTKFTWSHCECARKIHVPLAPLCVSQ